MRIDFKPKKLSEKEHCLPNELKSFESTYFLEQNVKHEQEEMNI
jgi:hypothetical protein